MFPETNYILSALLALPAASQFVIANAMRPPDSYLFATYLPEVGRPGYSAQSGNMTVHAVMAGLTGTSSRYPPGGFITASTTAEKTAKVANHVQLEEEDLRVLQEMTRNLLLLGGANARVATIQYVLDTVLNFYNKLVLQPHLDTAEYLRAQALVYGKIDWFNNGINLKVDYGMPAKNMRATRTGNDAWGGSTSKFWDDFIWVQDTLVGGVREIVMHPNTFQTVSGNAANGIEILERIANRVRIRRLVETPGGGVRPSSDAREQGVLTLYGLEAAKIDDTNPRQTVGVPFMPVGRMLGVGNPPANRFDVGRLAVGQGSTPSPNLTNALGITHIAPTVEGGGLIGRWGRVFQPENEPWAVVGQAVTNLIPVFDAIHHVANASSDMP